MDLGTRTLALAGADPPVFGVQSVRKRIGFETSAAGRSPPRSAMRGCGSSSRGPSAADTDLAASVEMMSATTPELSSRRSFALRPRRDGSGPPTAVGGDSRRRSSGRAVLVAIGLTVVAWAWAPFVLAALNAAVHHRSFLGADGYYLQDQLQYLAFIRDGHSGLIPDLYGGAGSAVFVDPIWSLSGIAQGLAGVSGAALMAFWKLVSIAALLAGVGWLVCRHIPASQPARRAAALALSLFGGLAPCAAVVFASQPSALIHDGNVLIPVANLWGYAPIAIAIALMPLAAEGMRLIVDGHGNRRWVLATAGTCLFVSWLHPWQGATLLLAFAVLLVWRWQSAVRAGRRPIAAARALLADHARAAIAIGVAGAAPIAYYVLLGRLSVNWANFSRTDSATLHIAPPFLLWCVLPLVAVALVAVRAARTDPRLRGLVAWLLGALLLLALQPPAQVHALGGVAVPLGILIVRTWPSRGGRPLRLVAAVGLAATAATFAAYGVNAFSAIRSPATTNISELPPSDTHAVLVAAQLAGGRPILSPQPLGDVIPALVDHSTWVGNQFWTPDWSSRATTTNALFDIETPTAAEVRQVLRASGARVMVEPCGYPAKLQPVMRQLGFGKLRIGCARVYAVSLRD